MSSLAYRIPLAVGSIIGVLSVWAMGGRVRTAIAMAIGFCLAFLCDALVEWSHTDVTKIGETIFPVCVSCGSTVGAELEKESGYLEVHPCDCCSNEWGEKTR